MFGICIGIFGGFLFGILIMCLLQVGGRHEEKMNTMGEEEEIEYYPDTCVWCGKFMWSVSETSQGSQFCSVQCENQYSLEQDYQEALAIHG